jgi:putative transposase
MVHAGWRSRGYLPHCDERGLVQHIVFGLADALPNAYKGRDDPVARLTWADREFDAGRGARLLAKAANAEVVQDSLLHADGARYALAAWCVMPTHVHVLVEQFDGHNLAEVVQRWKSFTAHAINKLENRSGPVWRREYFDRFMRSEQQFAWTLAYIENNPVAARLTANPGDWPYSSANWRR